MNTPSRSHSSIPQSQQGFTLIEVLVSLGLFSVGVLGFTALQAAAANLTQSSNNVTRAALLANELVADIQNAGGLPSLPAATYTSWQSLVSGATASNLGLPSGSGSYSQDASGTIATITITWQEPQRLDANKAQIVSQYQTVYTVN